MKIDINDFEFKFSLKSSSKNFNLLIHNDVTTLLFNIKWMNFLKSKYYCLQKNKQKTGCTIWKKNLSSWIPENQENQTEQTVVNLINKMVEGFSDHFKKANPRSKQAVFYVQKYQDL